MSSHVKDCLLLSQSNLEEKGAEALDLRVPFDEKATLEANVNYLVRSLEVCYMAGHILSLGDPISKRKVAFSSSK